jgi:hypothetical protein
MDNETIGNIIAITLLIAICSPVIIGCLDAAFISPYVAEDANQQCMARGFDYAERFTHAWFDKHALGVQCAIISVDKRAININGSAPIVVSS